MSGSAGARGRRAVPVDAAPQVALGEFLDIAIVHRHPVRLGRDQRVAHLLQHFLVAGARLAADIADGQVHDVVHLRHDIDLALELVRRIEEDGRGVGIALIDLGVDGHAGGAPLPRHRIMAARIEGRHRPSCGSTFLKFSIWSGRVSSSRPSLIQIGTKLADGTTMSKPWPPACTLASAVSLES